MFWIKKKKIIRCSLGSPHLFWGFTNDFILWNLRQEIPLKFSNYPDLLDFWNIYSLILILDGVYTSEIFHS